MKRCLLFVLPGLLALAACSPEPSGPDRQEQLAQAFFQQNRMQDLTPFAGLTVRLVRPVLKNDVIVLGHVYSLSFCSEVVDVQGQRGTTDLTYYYSDWPAAEYVLERRGYDSLQRHQLAELFKVPETEAKAAFVQWADSIVGHFNALNLPRAYDSPARYLQEVQACLSQDGQAVHFRLAPDVEVIYLADDAEQSLYWLREKKALRPLAPHWYWRAPRAVPQPVS